MRLMKKLWRLIIEGVSILVNRLRTQGLKTTLMWVYGRGLPFLTGIPTMQFSRITPQIYVGPQYNAAGKRKLVLCGINAGVNMRGEFDDAAHGLALEKYCHLPTVDDTAPTLEHIRKGIDFIREVVNDGGKVYIHCAGGIGRAPTIAAAYFMSRGYTLEEAIALIKKARPFINIMPPQMEQLKRFEAILEESS